jgi:hypothetical protein
MDKLEEFHYFVTPIYAIKAPQFLNVVRKISMAYLQASRTEINKMTVMTGNFSHEKEIEPFSQYVSQTVWNILNSQGINMDSLATFFNEMWCQEHNYQSAIDTHMHGNGSCMSVFYFLDMPVGACQMIIHDPRPAKVITTLPFKDDQKECLGSNQIVFTPQEGILLFAPPWLPHQFTRNNAADSVRFVHMNLGVAAAPQQNVEII